MNIPRPDMTFTCEMTLATEGQELVREMISQFPNACPECGFTHDSEMFRVVDGVHRCCSCNYALRQSDMFPSVLE